MPEEEVIPGLSFESLKQDNTTNEEEENIPGLSFESLQTPDISTDNLKKKEDEVPEATPLVQEGLEQSSPLASQPADTGSALPSSVETETPFSIPSFVPEEEKQKIEDYKKSLQEGAVPAEEQEQVDAYKAVIDQQGLTTERDINTFIDEVRNNPNILDDQRQKAELAALVKRDETVNSYKQEKQQRLADDLAWKIKTATQSAESIPDYLRIEKNKLRQTLDENSIEYKESGFDKRISEIKNADNVKLAVRTATNTLPNNARVKIKSLTTDEEREAYKQELLENINRSNKATGNHFSEFDIKSYSTNLEDLARFSSALESVEAKVAQVQGEKNVFLEETKFKELNKEIDDLNDKLINDSDLSDAERKSLEKAVSQRKMLKESFINNDGEKASEFVFSNIKENSDNFNLFKEALSKVPKDLTPKEQFEMFYLALRKTAAETYDKAFPERLSAANLTRGLREYLNWSKVPILDIPLPEGEFNLTETEEDAYELKTMVEGLSKIYFSNNAYTEDEGGFFEAAMGKFREYFYPKSASFRGVSSFRKTQEDVATALSETGIAEADVIDKEKINAFVETLAQQEKGVSFEKMGGTLGTSLGMMTELAAGSGILKGVGATTKMDVFLKSILGEGRVGKLLNSAIQEGVKAEFSGEVFNKKDELEFKQFFAGQVASDVIEKTLAKTGALKFATFLFKGIGLKPQIAIDAAGKIFSRAQGEFAEESMQQIVQAYSQTENGKSFVENLRAMFPDLDSVGEFYVMTTIMGGVFGIKGAHSDIAKKLEEGGYDLGEAKKAVGALMNDVRAAAKTANQKVAETKEQETKEPESAVEYKEPIVEEKEGEDTEYKDAEGRFFSEEEVLNMTPEEMSGMVIVNPSQAVSDKLSKKQEEDVQAKETEDKTEEVVEAPVTEGDKETTTQPVEAETTTEPVTETKTTEQVAATTEKKQDISFQKGVAESIGENVEDLSDVSEGSVKVTVGDTDLILNQSEDGNLVVDSIETQEGKKGQGSAEKAMDAVIQKANELGVDVELKVAPKEGTDTDTERLTDFYERKGFRSVGDGKMVKEPEPVVTTSELTQEQKNRNTVVSMKNEYNKLSPAKKKTKAGQEMLSNIIKLARENDLELAQKDGGKIDLINKKTGKSASVVGAKTTMSSPTQRNIERAKQAIKEGVFLYGGGYNQRVDVGLTRKEINDGVRDVEAGKYETESAKKLIDAVRKAHLEGGYTYMSGSGALIDRVFVPIQTSADEQQLKDEYGFTDEEIRMLNEEQESLAKEFDEWFMSQNQEVQNKIIENNEKQDGEQSGQAEQDTEGAKGENDVDGKKEQKQDGGESKSEGGEPGIDEVQGPDGETIRVDRRKITQRDLGREKKLRQGFKQILKNESYSQELKNLLANDGSIFYSPTTNTIDSSVAIEMVRAFDEIGELDTLLEDVERNYADYGAVGNFILQAAALHYTSQGRTTDAKKALDAKLKLSTIAAQILQSMKVNLDADSIEALTGVAMSVASNIENDIKGFRDTLLAKKANPSDKNSATVEEQILSGLTDLETAINVISKGIAENDAEVKKAIDKIVSKIKPEKKTRKQKSEEAQKKLEQEREYRKKIREEAKANKGKYFYGGFGLTNEGIEYAGNLAASYVRSGITNLKILADKVRQALLDDFGVNISDADIEKSFKKGNVAKIAEEVKEGKATEKLSKRIISELKEKKDKNLDNSVEALVRVLFSKAKETLPVREKTDTAETYREKLIEAMSNKEFSKEVWEASKVSVREMLNASEDRGDITGAEKAQILKDLDGFFADKIGRPFSKKLLDDTIKEQIKSDEDRISEIIKEHWTNKEERGRTLAEKIVADTDLTPEAATELAKEIEKRFKSLIGEYAEKALLKSLGIDALTGEVKKKNQITLKNIVDAINLGALDKDSYINAFGQRFGFGTITQHEARQMKTFLYNLTALPTMSSARDKELIRFRTFLESVRMKNKPLHKKLISLANEFFMKHILGTLNPILRSLLGMAWLVPATFFLEAVKNPKLFLKEAGKILKSPYTKIIKKEQVNSRLVNALWGAIKNDGWKVLKDAYKEGYVNYEIAQEGFDSGATLGVLDELHNTSWKDVKGPWRKVLKAIETPTAIMVRVLMAGDAYFDAITRPVFSELGAYNKALLETGPNVSRTEKEFWDMVDKYRSNTDAQREAAEAQAEEEYQTLLQKGVSTKDFDKKQRVKEILWENMDAEVKYYAERKSAEIRLGNNPTGTIGMISNSFNDWARKYPLVNYLIPFRRIPSSAMNMALDYTPVGLWRGVMGTGTFVNKSDNMSVRARERARVGKEFIKPFRKSQAGREYKGGELMNDRLDYLIKSTTGILTGSAMVYLALDSLNKDDDDPDNRFQITAKGKGSYADNVLIEQDGGLKPFHFRFKIPFTNTWSPSIDYRDSPFIMWMTAAGSISDHLKYDKGDMIPLETLAQKREALFDGDLAGSAVMESLLSFKEQAYMQALADVISATDLKDANNFGKAKTMMANQITRSVKGTVYPSFYTKMYQYYQTVKQSDVSGVTKAKEQFWTNLYETMAKDVFFLDFMLDDYVNNAGEKIQRPISAIPLLPETVIKGAQDYFGQYGSDNVTPSRQIMRDKPSYKFEDFFPDAMRSKTFVNKNTGKEIDFDTKLDFAKRYKEKYGAYISKNFNSIMKMDPEELKSDLQGVRGGIIDELLSKDFRYIERK